MLNKFMSNKKMNSMNFSPYPSNTQSQIQQQYRQQQAIAQKREMMRQTMQQQRLQGNAYAEKIQQFNIQQRMNQERIMNQRAAEIHSQRTAAMAAAQQQGNQHQPYNPPQMQQQQMRGDIRLMQPQMQPQPPPININGSYGTRNPNVIFYSDRCPHSQRFLQALEKVPVAFNKFVRVSVDVKGIKLPKCIKVVPTIVVYDDTGRRLILSDFRAFEWLNHIIDVPIEISNFEPGQMGTRLSDQYSWLDGQDEGDHSFTFLDEVDKHWIYTPPDGGDKKQHATDTDINYTQLESARNNDTACMLAQRSGPAPDFTKNAISERSKVSDSDFDRALQERNRDMRRGPTPQHAPNFQTGDFRSNNFQSKRGIGYQPSGEDVMGSGGKIQNSDFENLRSQRDREVFTIQRPQQIPDFSLYQKPMKVL